MDQIADETTLRSYGEDKDRVNKGKESSLCLRRGKLMPLGSVEYVLAEIQSHYVLISFTVV